MLRAAPSCIIRLGTARTEGKSQIPPLPPPADPPEQYSSASPWAPAKQRGGRWGFGAGRIINNSSPPLKPPQSLSLFKREIKSVPALTKTHINYLNLGRIQRLTPMGFNEIKIINNTNINIKANARENLTWSAAILRSRKCPKSLRVQPSFWRDRSNPGRRRSFSGSSMVKPSSRSRVSAGEQHPPEMDSARPSLLPPHGDRVPQGR